MIATATRSPARLSDAEQQRLKELERVIAHGKESFRTICLALEEIHRRRLYRDSYPSFKAYCAQRHGFLRETGYKFIRSGRVIRDSEANGLPAPTNHRQARTIGAARTRGRTESGKGGAQPKGSGRGGDQPVDLGTAVGHIERQLIGHIEALEELHARHPYAGTATATLRRLRELLLPWPPLPTRTTKEAADMSLSPAGLDVDDLSPLD